MSTTRRLTFALHTNHQLRREAFSMSLYVSIVLLSALSVFDGDSPPGQGEVLLLELGTTVGLVLAHGFASWVSTRLIGDASNDDPWGLLRVQLAGAVLVAMVSMLAVLLAPTSVELLVARFTVAGTIAVLVFLESRTSRSNLRAALLGLLALLAGVTVAALKAVLSH